MPKALELIDISFSYPDQEIFKDASFYVDEGDFVGIIGDNGAGKSTLLQLILKERSLTHGTIKLFGVDIRRFKHWQRIGFVPQTNFDTKFPGTVFEVVKNNLYSLSGFLKPPIKESASLVEEALSYVNMSQFKHKKLSSLSGGQLKRVMLARALVTKPDLLIMDEPSAGLDRDSQKSLYSILQEQNSEKNVTMIMVTHDPQDIKALADEFVLIEDLKIKACK